jgi:hypothetical protein
MRDIVDRQRERAQNKEERILDISEIMIESEERHRS